MKTVTSLSVPVVVLSILEEWLFMLVTCGSVIEVCHQLVKIFRRFMAVDIRQEGSATCLKLAVEEVM